MTTNFTRRIEKLEGSRRSKQQVYVFRRGPEDDAALAVARHQAERDGKMLVILSWFDAQSQAPA